MGSGTSSRPGRRWAGRWAAVMATGLASWAVAMPAGMGAARAQEGGAPARPAPGLEPSRPAPGLDTGASRPAPSLDTGPAPPASDPSIDPSLRYRFIEAYGPPQLPGADIGSYRVAFIETLNQKIEVPGAAPRQTTLDARVVYVGRPAIVGGSEGRNVTAVVRHYEEVQVARDGRPDPRAEGPTGLVGQTVWVEEQGRPAPTILTLPGSPAMTQEQFGFAAYQQIFVPDLAGILSPVHVGVGASWPVPPEAAQALVGGDPILSGGLEATLEDVLPPAEGETASRAIIRVSGRLELVNSSTAINARLEFAFTDPTAGAADDPGPDRLPGIDPTLIDVRGAIVRLLLAQNEVMEVAGADGRVAARYTQARELNLERRLRVDGPAVPALPSPTPTPTPENSWVIYRDPANRFLFRHPQDYRPAPIDPGDGETINLERLQFGGEPDYLTFVFFPKGEGLQIRPEAFSRKIVEVWRSVPEPGVTLGRGSEGTLPERDWPGMRVYRVELPLTYVQRAFVRADAGSAYFSAYLIQLANGAVLEIEGLTMSRADLFRQEVEAILRTFAVDPPPAVTLASPSAAPRPEASPPGDTTPPAAATPPAAPPEAPAPEADAPSPSEDPSIDLPPPEPGADPATIDLPPMPPDSEAAPEGTPPAPE